MPVTPTYPGVYVEEIPSGVRPITGVATSIAAFVDYFRRGPIDTAVRSLSMADFERTFGGLDTLSEASYGVRQFFLNGGSQAWIIRVGRDSPPSQPLAASTVTLDDEAGNDLLVVTAGMRVRGTSVDNPGTWGDMLRVEVDHDVAVPEDPALTIGETFNLTVSEVALQGGRQVPVRTEIYRNLTLRAGAVRNAIEVVNEASALVQLALDGAVVLSDPPERPAASGTEGTDLAVPPPGPPPVVADGSTFDLSVDGGAAVTCTLAYGGDSPDDFPSLRPHVQAAIRAAASSATAAERPYLEGATVRMWGKGTTAFPYRFAVLAGRGAIPFDPTTTLSFSGGVTGTLGLSGAAANAQQFALGGGGSGAPVTATEILGVQASKTGLFALEDADLFNILCIPRTADLDATSMRTVVSTAIAYCRDRRAFMIVDIPATAATPAGMTAWMATNDTLRDRNAAVYFPRPLIADPLNDFRLRSVGASGTLAGVYAATDAARGVWKAPAGTEAGLRGVQDLGYLLTDDENGLLNPAGINALRNFAVYGHVSWGARTLDGSDQQASEWKYVPVRRFALFLEESLFRGTKWVVFEPNDEPLWAQIRLNVGAFMHNLFVQGAFQGRTPREAYFVKCDAETTTQNDIDLGIVNILVGFAPLKPAEFVILRIQQKAPEPLT